MEEYVVEYPDSAMIKVENLQDLAVRFYFFTDDVPGQSLNIKIPLQYPPFLDIQKVKSLECHLEMEEGVGNNSSKKSVVLLSGPDIPLSRDQNTHVQLAKDWDRWRNCNDM